MKHYKCVQVAPDLLEKELNRFHGERFEVEKIIPVASGDFMIVGKRDHREYVTQDIKDKTNGRSFH